MPEFADPMLLRLELGNALREIRDARGLTIVEVTAAMRARYGSSFSAAKISRLETAQRAAVPRDVHDLCIIYEVADEERERLVELAVQTHKTETPMPDDQARGYRLFAALEEVASNIREFTAMFIPGLLQTPGYARLVENLQIIVPDYYSPYAEIPDVPKNADDRVKMRLKRQEVLERDNPASLHALIDESVLRRRLSDPEIMREQLRHLIAMSERPNVHIQVIPFEIGLYPGSETSYWSILDFPEGRRGFSRTIYLETAAGSQVIKRDVDVSRMINTFDALTKLAKDASATREFLRACLAGL